MKEDDYNIDNEYEDENTEREHKSSLRRNGLKTNVSREYNNNDDEKISDFKFSYFKSASINSPLTPKNSRLIQRKYSLGEPNNNIEMAEKKIIGKKRTRTMVAFEAKKEYNIQNLPYNYPSYDYLFKAVVLGDAKVGKTSIVLRATRNKFSAEYKSTLGLNNNYKIFKINEKVIKFQIFDTSGKENYQTLPPSLLKNLFNNISLAILVYSVDNSQSFLNIANWFNLIRLNSSHNTLMFLIGNKSDVSKREVVLSEGMTTAKNFGFELFAETSAKDGYGCDEIFREAVIQIMESPDNLKDFSVSTDYFSLDEKRNEDNRKGGCCHK